MRTEIPSFIENGSIWWIRRDIRLDDNKALAAALRHGPPIIPIFIFDTDILNRLEDPADRRVDFIHQQLAHLRDELHRYGSSLLVFHGTPAEVFARLRPSHVFTNHDYEGYGLKRDENIRKMIEGHGGQFHSFKDIVVFEKNEVLKDDGTPYTVFTPYSKKWKSTLKAKDYQSETADFTRLQKMEPQPFPTLADIGFQPTKTNFPPRVISKGIIRQYQAQRDFPAVAGTTRLSVHLRFGTVSIRQLVAIALPASETWLNELIWREFYHMILWHFPHVDGRAFKPAYDRIQWQNDPDKFQAWCEGRTGYPLVDAGMRELNATGFMHNRTRMVVASFLTKHLLIDWRWGEAYFAKKLLDFDLAANNGGWQWAAGCGCDAAPYFRVFNPHLQAVKFDPDQQYIRQWVPEVDTPNYPAPIVDHNMARDRAIKTYQEALAETSR